MLLFAIQFLWWTILTIKEFGIGSTNNPLIDIFLHSHHLFAWCCIDIWWEIGPENFPFISSSDPIKFKTWNNQDLMTGIFQHLILLHFTLSSYWLPVIYSFVLIGHYHNSNKKSSDLKKKKILRLYMYLSAPVFLLYTHWPSLQGWHLLLLWTC